MIIVKTSGIAKILLSTFVLSCIALEAHATAALDREPYEPELNKHSQVIRDTDSNFDNKALNSTFLKNKSNKELAPSVVSNFSKPAPIELEILNFSVTPLVSGNVLPHIPKAPPVLPTEEHFDQSKDLNPRPSLAWRITANALFSKKTKKTDFLTKIPFNSESVFNSIIKQGRLFNWKLKDSSFNARHIHFLIPSVENDKSLILSLKDDISGKFSHIRARTNPATNNSQLNLFFAKVTSSLEMKDVL